MTENGFTLLEIVIYTALSSILITVGLRMGYFLIESGHAAEKSALVNMEIQFITYKIDDELRQARSVSFPSMEQDAETIKFIDKNGLNVTIEKDNSRLVLSRNDEDQFLTTDYVEIEKFDVSRQTVDGIAVTEIDIRLAGQDFSFVRYDN